MAFVYKEVNGRKLEQLIALHQDVQTRIDDEAIFAAQKAEALLLSHKHSGASRIEVAKGKIDAYVVLDDLRGLEAAMTIEYGRKEIAPGVDPRKPEGQSGMAGLFILHRSFNIPTSRQGRNNRGGDNLNE